MAGPYRRPSRLRAAAKRHPAMLAVGIVCAIAVIAEIGAVTDAFGLLHPGSSSTSPTPPDLNPYSETFLAITSEVKYGAGGSDYFPEFEGQPICGAKCPGLPVVFTGFASPVIGLFFYFNVTNTASVAANFSLPALGVVGGNTAGFVLVTYCCYTSTNVPYSEQLTAGSQLAPHGSLGSVVGLRGFIYSAVSLPENTAGGYAFYFNVTATD